MSAMKKYDYGASMTSKKKTLMSIEGMVLHLSHTFRLQEYPLFLFTLKCDEIIYDILVKKKNHLSWHQNIHPGSFYLITDLKKDVIYKGTHDINILTTSYSSKLKLLQKNQYAFSQEIQTDDPSDFASLQAKIEAVIDDEVGVYNLEGNICLILAYLKDITAELCANTDDSQKTPKVSSDRSSLIENSLKVGDELSIYNAHVIKGKDGSRKLICCGRSLVRVNKKGESIYDPGKTSNAALHCLHVFNFGFDFLDWLLRLQDFILNMPLIKAPKDKIIKRMWNNEKGILCSLVEKLLKNKVPESRSLLSEFLLENHYCAILREFDGFKLVNINHVLEYNQSCNPANDANLLYDHRITARKDHNFLLFGVLEVTNGGDLRLKMEDETVDLLILGSKCELFSKMSDVVAVFDFDIVEENFHIEGGVVKRNYLIVQSDNVVSLDGNSHSSLMNGSGNTFSTYEIKVHSLSCLSYSVNDLKKNSIKGFFVAKALVRVRMVDINKEESWKTLIRFKGDYAHLYPFLSEPCKIIGKVASQNVSDICFRKTYGFTWLKPFYKYFGTSECAEVPHGFIVDSVCSISCRSSTDSIKDILEGRTLKSDIFNIEGIIVKKYFMTPKFDSQLVDVPLSCLQEGIGIPGSKIMRILVQDSEDSRFTIWVYFSRNSKLNVYKYNLGLLPGSKVCFTWLERCVSRKNLVYLSTTPFSMISVTDLKSDLQKLPDKHSFISELSSLPPKSMALIFATVSCILNITLKSVCPACESDFENGRCSFIGCHSNMSGSLAGSARIVIDDGTQTASLFIKELEQVKTLLCIADNEWRKICETAYSNSLHFRYKFHEDKTEQDPNILSTLAANPQVFRPLKLICRKFPPKEPPFSSHGLDLFAVSVNAINPEADITYLMR